MIMSKTLRLLHALPDLGVLHKKPLRGLSKAVARFLRGKGAILGAEATDDPFVTCNDSKIRAVPLVTDKWPAMRNEGRANFNR